MCVCGGGDPGWRSQIEGRGSRVEESDRGEGGPGWRSQIEGRGDPGWRGEIEGRGQTQTGSCILRQGLKLSLHTWCAKRPLTEESFQF